MLSDNSSYLAFSISLVLAHAEEDYAAVLGVSVSAGCVVKDSYRNI